MQRILIIESDKNLATSIKDSLEFEGFEAFISLNEKDARTPGCTGQLRRGVAQITIRRAQPLWRVDSFPPNPRGTFGVTSTSPSRVSLWLAKVPATLRVAAATRRSWREVRQAGGLFGRRKPEAYATIWWP